MRSTSTRDGNSSVRMASRGMPARAHLDEGRRHPPQRRRQGLFHREVEDGSLHGGQLEAPAGGREPWPRPAWRAEAVPVTSAWTPTAVMKPMPSVSSRRTSGPAWGGRPGPHRTAGRTARGQRVPARHDTRHRSAAQGSPGDGVVGDEHADDVGLIGRGDVGGVEAVGHRLLAVASDRTHTARPRRSREVHAHDRPWLPYPTTDGMPDSAARSASASWKRVVIRGR